MKNIYQIDQSGKVEQTQRHSVVACTNGETMIVLLPAKEKRRLQQWFRLVGAPTLFVDTTFAIMVYLSIKNLLKKTTRFIIDIEYQGRTKVIEDMIARLTQTKLTISWKSIGKTSKAHDVAYNALRKREKVKKTSAEVVWKLAIIASRRLATKIAGGRLTQEWLPGDRRSAPASKKNIAKRK